MKKEDAGFCAWLRDEVKVDAEWFLDQKKKKKSSYFTICFVCSRLNGL
jgi:hypothetical protein